MQKNGHEAVVKLLAYWEDVNVDSEDTSVELWPDAAVAGGRKWPRGGSEASEV